MAIPEHLTDRERSKFVEADGQTAVRVLSGVQPYITRIANDGSGNPEYLGEALPGTASNATSWRIKKFVYSGGAVVSILWAGGSSSFTKSWDSRASYTYS